jgi:hypothetical protein
MAHFKKSFPSKFLQASDLDTPITATIASVRSENVGSGPNQELKLVAYFSEIDLKPMVLNLTKSEALASLAGDDDTDAWTGTRISLSRGQTRYQGKTVGCIVVSAPPKTKPPKAARPATTPPDDPDDAIPTTNSEVGF